MKQFASLNTSEYISEYVQDVYEVELTPDQVATMNPETFDIYILDDKWHTVFNEERKKALSSLSHFPIANKFKRAEWLQLRYDIALRNGDEKLMILIAEAIRKETDDLYWHLVRVFDEMDYEINPIEFKA